MVFTFVQYKVDKSSHFLKFQLNLLNQEDNIHAFDKQSL